MGAPEPFTQTLDVGHWIQGRHHAGTGTRSQTITPVCPIITVTPATLPNALIGTAFSQT